MTSMLAKAIDTRDTAIINVLELIDGERLSLKDLFEVHSESPTRKVVFRDDEGRPFVEAFAVRLAEYMAAQREVERVAALPVKVIRHYRPVNVTRDVLVVKGMSPRGALDCIHLGVDLGQDRARWERHGVGRDEAWDYIGELKDVHGPSMLAVAPY